MMNPFFPIGGGIVSSLAPQAQQQLQNSQSQHMLNLMNMLGNLGLGYSDAQNPQLGYNFGPPHIVRCAYCGKRPKAERDDRCDGCGAPR